MIVWALVELKPWRLRSFEFKKARVVSVWKRAWAGVVVGHGLSPVVDQTVQQMDPHRQRQLLAGDSIDQCLKDGREARRLEPAQMSAERAE